MAISVAWLATVNTTAASSTVLTTVATSSTSATYGVYARDLVVNNGHATASLYVSASPSATSAATVTGFLIPAGGSVILTQCQVPQGTVLYGMSNSVVPVNIGFATNVSFT